MIEGLHLDVPAHELMARIDDRIAYHEARAAACEARLGRLAEITDEADSELEPVHPFREIRPRDGVERMLRSHRDRAAFLGFLRDHLVADEIYRLGETDLQTLEIAPAYPITW